MGDSEKGKSGGRLKRWIIIAVIVVVVALALGLGLGLGIAKAQESDEAAEPGREKWIPHAGTSWQIVLQQSIAIDPDDPSVEPDVDVFDLDLYTNPESTFDALRSLGKRVICYFSAGSYEPYRPDSDQFAREDLGLTMDGWPDERWINISSPGVRDIMAARIELASSKGCDAIDPDNVDGFQNENGLGLTAEDTVDFVRFLSSEAARYNLTVGLKNAGSIIEDVLDVVDFSVNEQCVEYEECEVFAAFIQDDKPVFHIEYPDGAPDDVSSAAEADICSGSGASAGTDGFSTVIKTMDLDGWVLYCDGDVFTTELDG